jgi:F-type H+-transporting ATPase subunit epsilon
LSSLKVQLVAADRPIWSGDASIVVARTAEGDIGILPGHEPVLATLADSAMVTIRTADGAVVAAVHGGFLSVARDDVSILAETAELAEEIDAERARLALEKIGQQPRGDEESGNQATLAQQRAETRLLAAQARVETH